MTIFLKMTSLVKKQLFLLSCALGASVLLFCSTSFAFTCTWVGAASSLWSNAANWSCSVGSTGVPVNGDDVKFLGAGTTFTSDNFPNLTLNTLTLSGADYSISGGVILNITSGVTVNSNTQTITPRLTLANDQTYTAQTGGVLAIQNQEMNGHNLTLNVVDSASHIVVNGQFLNTPANAVNVIKTGPGELNFVSNPQSVQTIGLDIKAGTVSTGGVFPSFSSCTSFCLLAGPVTIESPGTLSIAADEAVDNLNGQGALQLGTHKVLLRELSSGSSTFSGNITGTNTVEVGDAGTLTLNDPNPLSFAGNIFVDNGGTLVLSNINTSASLNDQGTVSFVGAPHVGAITASFLFPPGAVLDLGTASVQATSLSLATPATLNTDIASQTSFGNLTVTGATNFNNQGFTVIKAPGTSYVPVSGDVFDIVHQASASPNHFNVGSTVTFNGQQLAVSYTGGPGNDFILTASSAPSLTSTTTTLTSTPDPSTFGQSVTLTASISPAVPNGQTVTFFDGATSIGTATTSTSGSGSVAQLTTSSLSAGGHDITATYAGDSTFASSTSTVVSQTVDKASTATALTSTPNASVVNQSVTFTATVTGSGTIPNANVTFIDTSTTPATTLGTATTTGGVATIVATFSNAGTHTITATYAGNSNFASSTSPTHDQIVNAAGLISTTTALTSTPNPSTTGQSVTFTATVNPLTGSIPDGENVTFMDTSTATALGTRTTTSGVATITTTFSTTGTHTITATYAGDSTHGASISPTLTQTVNSSVSTPTPTPTPAPAGGGGGGGCAACGNLGNPGVVLSSSPGTTQNCTGYKDLSSNDPDFAAFMFLCQKGIITGNPDGTVTPNMNVQRDQITKIVLKSWKPDFDPTHDYCNKIAPFPDVTLDNWAANYVCYSVQHAIVTGYLGGADKGYFRPARSVNWAEFAVLVTRNIQDTIPSNSTVSYSNVPVNQWFSGAAAYFKNNKLAEAFPLNQAMSRRQVAEVLYKLHQLGKL